MTPTQADILVRLIEAATDGNWPSVRRTLVDEQGWSPREIIDATDTLCKLAHVSPIISLEDF